MYNVEIYTLNNHDHTTVCLCYTYLLNVFTILFYLNLLTLATMYFAYIVIKGLATANCKNKMKQNIVYWNSILLQRIHNTSVPLIC